MKSKTYRISLLTIICAFYFSCNGQSILGIWQTIDDKTKKPASYVEIYEVNQTLFGRVTEIIKEGSDPNAVCESCTGDRKDQPIVGMDILEGLTKQGNQWTGGTILDPENGKTYQCYIEMVSEDKLKLRGYIGLALIGRTQYWYRKK